MTRTNTALSVRAAFLILLASILSGCIGGVVRNSHGVLLSEVEVTAYTQCNGAGCAGHQIDIPVRAGTLTGYQVKSNVEGQYVYDPYAKVVAPEDAMLLTIPNGSPDNFIKFSYTKEGYQDIWLDFVPEYSEHQGNDGKTYHIASVPKLYLCATDAIDTDEDGICDDAETFYQTDPFMADSDGNGIDDHAQLFGTGSLIGINTLSILHANVNVTDFAASKAFYELLGFNALLEVDVDVSDPEEAAGLDMPPYQLHAAPMALSDGYIVDLIRWNSPYDASAPYAEPNHLGIASLALQTTNLAADMAALMANNISFTGPETVNIPVANSQKITFTDPDGSFIELVQPGNVATGGTPNASGVTYITGALQTNINVSDYEVSRDFYQALGFEIEAEVEEGSAGSSYHVRNARMSLPNGHELSLTKWEAPTSSEAPYDDLNHIGIARVAIETANIDEDIKILEKLGIEFYSSPITPSGPLSILRYVCFEDPDGTVIELVDYNN